MQSDIRTVHTCLAVTCHLRFWQNEWDLLRATTVTQGGAGTEIRVSTESGPGEENSPAVPAGTRTRELSITSPVL